MLTFNSLQVIFLHLCCSDWHVFMTAVCSSLFVPTSQLEPVGWWQPRLTKPCLSQGCKSDKNLMEIIRVGGEEWPNRSVAPDHGELGTWLAFTHCVRPGVWLLSRLEPAGGHPALSWGDKSVARLVLLLVSWALRALGRARSKFWVFSAGVKLRRAQVVCEVSDSYLLMMQPSRVALEAELCKALSRVEWAPNSLNQCSFEFWACGCTGLRVMPGLDGRKLAEV